MRLARVEQGSSDLRNPSEPRFRLILAQPRQALRLTVAGLIHVIHQPLYDGAQR
jgi:hypothetical protein